MSRLRDNPTDSPRDLPAFTRAEFVCFLARPPIFTSAGQLLFSLLVEPDNVEDALPLRWLTRDPLPVRCSLEADIGILDTMADYARDD